MEAFLQYLNTIYPLSDELREHLKQTLKIKELSKKDYLLKAGHICQYIYFIQEGLLRCFYDKHNFEDKQNIEVCSWFMKEGDFIISVESFFNQKPSCESIQALEDCKLIYISYQDLQYGYKHFIELNFIGRALTEKYYALSEQRLYSLRMKRARERYEYLIGHFPELVQRVASNDIASYLGVSRETLSRIKKVRRR